MSSSREPLPEPPKWDPNDFTDIDFDTVEKDTLNEYIKWCTQAFQYEEWHDLQLWQAYQIQFEKFTEKAFAKATPYYLAKLRTQLRTHGVFVDSSRNVKMAKALHITAQEESQADWPRDELETQMKQGICLYPQTTRDYTNYS